MNTHKSKTRSDNEFARLSHSLVERAMELRCNAYLSQAKHQLLMQTILDLNSTKHSLTKTNKQLKELDRIKTLFIASMVHELNNPLTSIIGYSDMVIKGTAGPLTETQQSYLQNVINSAELLKYLVADAMDIAKIESNVIEPHVETFALREVITEAISQIAPMAETKNLDITLQIPEEVNMISDRNRLIQCLINLLSNAVKYTDKGSILISVRPELEKVYIKITDTGVGISLEDIQHLYEAFRRGASAERTKELGTGIGLFLTNKLVHNVLKGTISVTSVLRKGSEFTLLLPLDLDQQLK